MKKARVLLLVAFVSQLMGCASLRRSSHPAVERDSDPLRVGTESESLASWEKRLEGMKGTDRVLVPAQVLRSWIRNEKIRDEKYRELVSQLKALKSIDLEETGSSSK